MWINSFNFALYLENSIHGTKRTFKIKGKKLRELGRERRRTLMLIQYDEHPLIGQDYF